MATAGQMFLRLPSSLRQQMFLQEPARLGQLLRATGRQNISRRTFQSTAKLDRRGPAKSTAKKSLPTPPPQPYKPVPKTPDTPSVVQSQAPPVIPSQALGVDHKILVYTAPNHGAFFVSSIAVGTLFVLGAYAYAQLMLKETMTDGNDTTPDGSKPDASKQHWAVRTIGLVSVVAVVGFGTVFILAPQKMIKSIAVVTKEGIVNAAVAPVCRLPRTLRIEVKRVMPFVKPDVMEVKLTDVAMDRHVPTALEELDFLTVSKSDALLWAEDYFTGKFRPDPYPKGFWGSIRAIPRGTVREVRRMFLRDQMARIRVENNGTFKLDLRKCYVLDHGRALANVLQGGVVEDMSLVTRLRAVLRPSNR